jgi:hypothetical protein
MTGAPAPLRGNPMTSRFIRTPLRAAIAATVVTGIVVGGMSFAFASIPDSTGVIHGCYKTNGTLHDLKVIDNAVTASCPTGYSPLNWNQSGPPGSSGLSHGYSAESIDGYTLSEASFTTVVTSATLPAGSYIVNATVGLTSVLGTNGAQCFITNGGGNATGATVSTNNGVQTVPMTGAVTLTSSGTITVQCVGTGQTTGENLTAIAVNALN